MRVRRDALGLDDIDRRILKVLQADCKTPLAKVGEAVGLSAPSIVERVRRLEHEGFVLGYHARLDARRLGMEVTAFVGVALAHPEPPETFDSQLAEFRRRLADFGNVMECHHVTGNYTLLIKLKTRSTSSLQGFIGQLRSLPAVQRTETNVVLSTLSERIDLIVDAPTERGSRTRGEPGPAGKAKPDGGNDEAPAGT
ncbi:MAG: Lrp/AsnC family transcriptional regulator [Proteobacteria bacterium]|nr:Lrp/AsnC family transcriptional regulator [Pseudomonadota bacterium]